MFQNEIKKANSSLLKARDKRVRPTTDDKILTSWNSIMLSGYIEAYKALGDKNYIDTAIQLAAFLEKNVICNDGKIYRNFKNGKAVIEGFLDDYALLSEALINLYESTFDINYLKLANKLTKYTLNNFKNNDNPLFFYTSKLSEQLFTKDVEISDNVMPSSNSVMATVLFKLGHLLDNDNYIEVAENALLTMKDNIFSGTPYYSNWAKLAGLMVFKPIEISIVGNDYRRILSEFQKFYLPNVFFSGGDKENLKMLRGKLVRNKTLIYLCHNKVCEEPTENVKEAIEKLNRILSKKSQI